MYVVFPLNHLGWVYIVLQRRLDWHWLTQLRTCWWVRFAEVGGRWRTAGCKWDPDPRTRNSSSGFILSDTCWVKASWLRGFSKRNPEELKSQWAWLWWYPLFVCKSIHGYGFTSSSSSTVIVIIIITTSILIINVMNKNLWHCSEMRMWNVMWRSQLLQSSKQKPWYNTENCYFILTKLFFKVGYKTVT